MYGGASQQVEAKPDALVDLHFTGFSGDLTELNGGYYIDTEANGEHKYHHNRPVFTKGPGFMLYYFED